jgi:hypothetical protein
MMNMKRKLRVGLVAVECSLVLLVMGCKEGPQSRQAAEPPVHVQPYLKKVEEGQAKKRAMEAEYKAMQVSELVGRLEVDSKRDIEPFNSPAYREAVSRGPAAGEALASFINTNDKSSFLSLIAIRKVNKNAYDSVDGKIKAAILVDALRASKYFNTWGLPHSYWESSAKAIIELGDVAVEPLMNLLQDRRAAPVWGSEEALEYKKYKYRVNDYAWALLMEIKGRKIQIPVDPKKRDQMISDVNR